MAFPLSRPRNGDKQFFTVKGLARVELSHFGNGIDSVGHIEPEFALGTWKYGIVGFRDR